MKLRSIVFACATPLLATMLAWAGQAVAVESVQGGNGTHNPNPDCQTDGVYCNWVNVVVPEGSQIDSALVFASVDGENWTACTPSSSGAFMDCGKGVRFLNLKPSTAPSTGGLNVTWKMMNLNTHKEFGKLVVNYH